jgi:hypothetical protein
LTPFLHQGNEGNEGKIGEAEKWKQKNVFAIGLTSALWLLQQLHGEIALR